MWTEDSGQTEGVSESSNMSHSEPNSLLLRDILAIEDDEEILSFRCPRTGYFAWPTVRHNFVSYLMHELAFPWSAYIGPPLALRGQGAALPALIRSITHNLQVWQRGAARHPVMIISTTNGLVEWRGKTFNRYSDHFAMAIPGRSVAYEIVMPPRYEVPGGRANPDVLYTLPTLAARYLTGSSARAGAGEVARNLTRFLAERSERLFGLRLSPERRAITDGFIRRGVGGYAFDQKHYRKLFSRNKPRMLFVIAPTVGGWTAMIQVAHDLGISIAEYQHGACGSGQPDYNFAATLLNSAEYRRGLPDYFLSYGPWWTDQTNAPMRPVAIGNPHRTECLAVLQSPSAEDRVDVLVVAKFGDLPRYVALASELDRLSAGRLRIGLRPNPREMQDAARLELGGIHLDCNPDFYPSLLRADAVVGGPSTTLVEALGLAKRVFIWEQAGAAFKYPDPLFERFSTAAELIRKLAAPPDPNVQLPSADALWTSNWRDRYADFLAPFQT
jgi:hypothetical protein